MGLKGKLAATVAGLAAIVGAYTWIGSSGPEPIKSYTARLDMVAIQENIPQGKTLYIPKSDVGPENVALEFNETHGKEGSLVGKTYITYDGEKIHLTKKKLEALKKLESVSGITDIINGEEDFVELVKSDPQFDPDYRNWYKKK